jgi:hypothetical protein
MMTDTVTLTLNRREAEILADVMRRAQTGGVKLHYDYPTVAERTATLVTAITTLDLALEG